MTFLRRATAALRALLRRRHIEQDLDAELREYLEMAVDRKTAAGMSREEAIRAARVDLGGIEVVKDRIRDVGWESILDSICQDVRYAVRGLRKSPTFTSVAISTLALGIGANTAIFSVVYGVLLRPLPYLNTDRVVRIFERLPPRRGSEGTRRESPLANSDLARFRSQATTLSQIGIHAPAMITMAGRDGPVRLVGVRLSPAIFSMLSVAPLVGRVFDARDEAPGADAVVILSSTMWQRYFSSDPAIIGRSLELDGRGYSVVGVMPRDFQVPEGRPEFWIPFTPPTSGPNMRQRLPLMARVKDAASISSAAAEVNAVLTQLRAASAGSAPADSRFELIGVQELLVAPVKPALVVLLAAVGFVLLIACVNVANLLLARSAARQPEIAIRFALGAGRSRLVRQALTESMLLAFLGGAAGTALASGGIQLFRILGATQPGMGPGVIMPRLDEIGIDPAVLGFTVAVSTLAGLIAGLAPTIRQWSPGGGNALHDSGSRTAGTSRHQRRLQSALVVTEVGMAMLLLVGAGLLIRSFVNLSSVRPGYDPLDVLTFRVSLPPGRSDTQLARFGQDLADRLAALPRVRSVGYAESLPLARVGRLGWLGTGPDMPRDPEAATRVGATGLTVSVRVVSRDFLAAMGTRVIAGRGFAESDGAGEPQVLLINQTLARSAFLNDHSLGTQLYVVGSVTFDPRRLGPNGQAPRPWQIVGIVEDVRQTSLDQEPGPEVFVDFRQLPGPSGPPGSLRYFAIRIGGDPAPVASSIGSMARQLDSQAMVENVAPMEQFVSSSISRPRLYAVLLGIFSGIAVALAAMGIYGVMAYSVAQRTREIGIRVALGAARAQVMALVFGQSAVLIGLGIVLGVAGAAALSRYLKGMLFGLTSLDPLTFVAMAVVFAAVATVAAFVPACRAAKVDPLVALRAE